MAIPKIIHYIWFGDNPIPDEQKEFIKHWKELMPDYEFKFWNDSNVTDDSAFFNEAMRQKKYAFATDYIRLQVLYNMGGIYLDTDVDVKQRFDDYLQYTYFCGFIFDCLLGTAVIGAEKENKLLIEQKEYLLETFAKSNKFIVNNNWTTEFWIKRFPEFRLNGKTQILEGHIYIGNKYVFEREYFGKKPAMGICQHKCAGAWKKQKNSGYKAILRKVLGQRIYKWMVLQYNLIINPYFWTYVKDKFKGDEGQEDCTLWIAPIRKIEAVKQVKCRGGGEDNNKNEVKNCEKR